MSLLAAAHEYSRRGFRVIALHRVGPDGVTCSCRQGANCGRNAGKHPKDTAWQKAPRLSGADIEEIWGVERPPNIGIATGSDSGIWVLDIDPDSGGMESMAALVAEHGPMPTTMVARTGSGGYHYFFALPDFEVRNDQSGRVAQGIDVRGEGGQVVAPPSRSGKGDYTLVVDAPVAAAPAWLLEKVRKEEKAAQIVTAEELPRPEDIDEATWARYSAYAQRAIDAELARLDACRAAATANLNDYRGEPWNHTTFEVACALLEFANSPWCSYSLGQAQADIRARAPRDAEFDDWVVQKTFDSARARVGDKARPVPADRTPSTAADDPMFSDPSVPGSRPGPTEGGGDARRPTRQLFGGEKGNTPLYASMAAEVLDQGPIGWGTDNTFWTYDGGVWRSDPDVVMFRMVDMLGEAYRKAHTTNASDIVRRRAMPLTGDPLEPLINFRNGMLDWRTGVLSEHDPGYGSTVQLGTEWDPEADCPAFHTFLSQVMHEDYIHLTWQMIGYLMMSGNPLQVAFMLYGSGGNGKGTLLRVIGALLGRENIASEPLDELNGNRFRSANLFGKIANLAGDIDATYQEHTATFKRLTGEDETTAERKGQDSFQFVNWAVPVFSANKFPGSADVTEGYLRRWIIVHFHKKISDRERVPGLDKILFDEAPGIARRGVEALRDLMARGSFDVRGEATKGKDEFAMTIDQVRQWLAAEANAAPGVDTPLDALYASYVIWAERNANGRLRSSEFSSRLEAIGYEATRVAGTIYHRGISASTTPHAARYSGVNAMFESERD